MAPAHPSGCNAWKQGASMDFDDTPDEAVFRRGARAWLEHHAPRRHTGTVATRARWRDPSPEAQDRHVAGCRAWQRTLADGGWAGITWPVEFGGRAGTPMEQAIFNQEQARFEVATGSLAVALGMVGPTLMAWGTPEQQATHLDAMLHGDEVWCQLFSEPDAGSDLASLRTTAVHEAGGWVVNGQKVWTSLAQHSQWAILLARTDPSVPKNKGITYFLVDMDSEGIEVRPLRQIDGVAHFNEVYLTDVRIPEANVVGKVDEGWLVARTTLQSERVMIGGGGISFDDFRPLAATAGADRRPVVRQGLVEAYSRLEILRYLGFRVQTALSQGRPPGPESSILKLFYSLHIARTADLMLELEGASAMLGVEVAPDGGFWQQYFLSQWSSRIGGGTDQIQRNIIGERVLGLPREPAVSDGSAGRL